MTERVLRKPENVTSAAQTGLILCGFYGLAEQGAEKKICRADRGKPRVKATLIPNRLFRGLKAPAPSGKTETEFSAADEAVPLSKTGFPALFMH